ncbi:hypothetical protein Gbth_009_022 [Gluconobacter thailandicus F149-1 = NBRC 100600]|nr:hypothetical protein Gbth_009_022 [Gluconobacter thailandicus F149-1 = NBRC 100600]GBR61258.1 hypothetical protein AA100600_2616 [Gluconobacter thailandicus F149-1 = NBRC 100600]GEL87919.1 hypothetical protein GTH01_22770 [Gluconobacter thailandicus F149-1 = NBRC 100600]
MRDEAGLFVQNDQIPVFIENGKGQVLCHRACRQGGGKGKDQIHSFAQNIGRFTDSLPVPGQMALFDKGLDPGAGNRADGVSEGAIYALACQTGINNKAERGFRI